MEVLVPVDGSDASERAVRFAASLVAGYGGRLHAVHVTDEETDATAELLDRVRAVLADEGVPGEPSVTTDVDLAFRPARRVGEAIVELVEAGDYDHVVMGHHGTGVVDRVILGSAAETVLESRTVSVTVVP